MKSRSTPRFTALFLGFNAEILMGGALLIWLTIPSYADRAPFGPVVSKVVLITAMVALALAMFALALATQLSKVMLRTCVMVVSPVVAGEGALAIGSLFSDPSPFLLLAVAWIFSVLVVVAISRASVRRTACEHVRTERA